jgi:hypothetical protein
LTRYPSLLYGTSGLWMLRIGIPLTTAVMGGYYSNYYRRAGNSTFGNLLSNNRYVYAKNMLIRNFVILNRRFTEDERKQFIFNIDLQNKGRKKYVYNPFLFATEEEYKKYYDRVNSGKALLSDNSKSEIAADNQEKVQKHEGIVYQKPNYQEILKFDDRHLGLKRLQLINKEFII